MTLTNSSVPDLRWRVVKDGPVRVDGAYVVYWMIAARRTRWNFALDRAMEWARELNRPLVVFEPLRCDYAWASDRLHRFVMDGMAANAKRLEGKNVAYRAFVERKPGEGRQEMKRLLKDACLVVTDDFPAFFYPRMLAAAAERFPVRLEAVDSNGLLPLRAADRAFPRAYSFRRFLQQELPRHLAAFPRQRPAFHTLPEPPAKLAAAPTDIDLAKLPIDHDVAPTADEGGEEAGRNKWQDFVAERLDGYAEGRNEESSGLSPYLHFGHVSPHELLADIAEAENWSLDDHGPKADGAREGWWGLSTGAEAFLDQLVTWRELGFNMCALARDHDRYDSLPDWARATLEKHEADPREYVYDLAAFEAGETHDGIWNVAQNQLVAEGRIHNYLRMLWGKKILEWSPSPRDALATMIELNNKYALDGRDPNSSSGIFWILGRYDRAWGPERPIFGTVRYMSSDSTRRKLRAYLDSVSS